MPLGVRKSSPEDRADLMHGLHGKRCSSSGQQPSDGALHVPCKMHWMLLVNCRGKSLLTNAPMKMTKALRIDFVSQLLSCVVCSRVLMKNMAWQLASAHCLLK